MKIVDNYLNSLESYLPDELKQDVREELEASIYGQIEDQSAEKNAELSEQEVEVILKGIGHPIKVASAYLPNQELVSCEYFPAYKKSLEIVFFTVIIIKFLLLVPYIFTSGNVFSSIFKFALGSFETALWVFAWVTLVFYILQVNKVNIDSVYAWSAKEINARSPKFSIKRIELFFELVMEVVFLAWWNDLLKWPSEITQNGISSTFALSQEWSSVYLTVNLIMGLAIALSFYKLVLAGWNKQTLIANILLNVATLVVLVQISLFEQFVSIANLQNNPDIWSKAILIFDNITYSFIVFIALYVIWESYSNYKLLKRSINNLT